MINEFYYKILNLNPFNNDIEKEIKESINQITNSIRKTNHNLERLCKVVSNNLSILLSNKKIDNRIINLKNFGLYEHEVIICRNMVNDQINYYLIDPTFNQFRNYYPYNNLMKINKQIFNNIITEGYTKINNQTFNHYLQAFNYTQKSVDINQFFIEYKNRKK